MTGAGVSAESGIPTFRDKDGLWEGRRPEEVATPEAFAADPEDVWRFYLWRRRALSACQPNPGHHALAQLEQYPQWAPQHWQMAFLGNFERIYRLPFSSRPGAE